MNNINRFKELAQELKDMEIQYNKDGNVEYGSAMCIARVKLEVLIDEISGCGRFNRVIDI